MYTGMYVYIYIFSLSLSLSIYIYLLERQVNYLVFSKSFHFDLTEGKQTAPQAVRTLEKKTHTHKYTNLTSGGFGVDSRGQKPCAGTPAFAFVIQFASL